MERSPPRPEGLRRLTSEIGRGECDIRFPDNDRRRDPQRDAKWNGVNHFLILYLECPPQLPKLSFDRSSSPIRAVAGPVLHVHSAGNHVETLEFMVLWLLSEPNGLSTKRAENYPTISDCQSLYTDRRIWAKEKSDVSARLL
jgi:hypothetical protein